MSDVPEFIRGLVTEIEGSLLRRGQFSVFTNLTMRGGYVTPRKSDEPTGTAWDDDNQFHLDTSVLNDVVKIQDADGTSGYVFTTYAGGAVKVRSDNTSTAGEDLTLIPNLNGREAYPSNSRETPIAGIYFGPLDNYPDNSEAGTTGTQRVVDAHIDATADDFVVAASWYTEKDIGFEGHTQLNVGTVSVDYTKFHARGIGTISGAAPLMAPNKISGPFNWAGDYPFYKALQRVLAKRDYGIIVTEATSGAKGFLRGVFDGVSSTELTFIIEQSSGTFDTGTAPPALTFEVNGTYDVGETPDSGGTSGTLSGGTNVAMQNTDKYFVVVQGSCLETGGRQYMVGYSFDNTSNLYRRAERKYRYYDLGWHDYDLSYGTKSLTNGWDMTGGTRTSSVAVVDRHSDDAELADFDDYPGPFDTDGLYEVLEHLDSDCQCAAEFKGSLLVGQGKTIRYSDSYDIRLFRDWAVLNLNSKVLRIVSRDDTAEVYTEEGIQYIVGNPPYFELRETNVTDGIVSPRAVAPTEMGTFILMPDGVYLFRNGQITPVTVGNNTPWIDSMVNPESSFAFAANGVAYFVDATAGTSESPGNTALAFDYHANEMFQKKFPSPVVGAITIADAAYTLEEGTSGTNSKVASGTSSVEWVARYAAGGDGRSIVTPTILKVDCVGEFKLGKYVDDVLVEPAIRIDGAGDARLPKARGRKWYLEASGTDAKDAVKITRLKRG